MYRELMYRELMNREQEELMYIQGEEVIIVKLMS